MDEDFLFAWEGASAPGGPWKQLRVKAFRGSEGLSEGYSYEIDLVCPASLGTVDTAEMIGAWGSLAIRTGATPAIRFVHGVVAGVEELGQGEDGERLRVTLAPPTVRASMMRKSIIHLDKTLAQIVKATLEREVLGAGLASCSDLDRGAETLDPTTYRVPRATYGFSLQRSPRFEDPRARPYCVQYDEDDWSFVARLLEEEGIAYHYEHNAEECVLVMTDDDGGRIRDEANDPLGPEIAEREIVRMHVGARLRPRAVVLDDFDMRRPDLALLAPSPSGVGPFTTIESPGRYQGSAELGKALALVREERLDTERRYATAETPCRFLQAGSVFWLSHPSERLSGHYLVTRIRMEGRSLMDFSEGAAKPYRATIEALYAGPASGTPQSRFRPERRTRCPRIHGTQTAIVTADPSAPDAEIWVGGDENLGSVRLRFHWDLDVGRLAKEPSSCWVRVSQLFAGASHGAMWHPRVGEEVVVDFLDGDPDRPLVVGRVYNGKNLPPENATAHPTRSCIKSLTSPKNGNYNELSFEDRQGNEEIRIHAARDFILESLHDNVRVAGNNDKIHVKGKQTVQVDGLQETTYLADETHQVVGTRTTNVDAGDSLESKTSISMWAPDVKIVGDAMLTLEGGLTLVVGRTLLTLSGATVVMQGDNITVDSKGFLVLNAAGAARVTAPSVSVQATTVSVSAKGEVNVQGGLVNLNC